MKLVSLLALLIGTANSGWAQVIYTIDKSNADIAILHPGVQNNPVARLPINFGSFTGLGANIQVFADYDMTYARGNLYVLMNDVHRTSADYGSWLWEIDALTGDVLRLARVTNIDGSDLRATAEGLAFDGHDLLIGYHTAPTTTATPFSESNTVEKLNLAEPFGRIMSTYGYHSGDETVDTDGLTTCGERIVGLDNANNPANSQFERAIYDMGTFSSGSYTEKVLLPASGTPHGNDIAFLPNGRLAVITNDTNSELLVYDDLSGASPSITRDLPGSVLLSFGTFGTEIFHRYAGLASPDCSCTWVCEVD